MFERIGIVGVGLIGGSFGLAMKRALSGVSVVGVGRDRARLEVARSMGAIDEAATDPAALSYCDLVVLATPVDHILSSLPGIAARLAPGTVLTDVGSSKREICLRGAAACPPSVAFVGGHPIAGRELAGVEGSLADLFEGAPWILCPVSGAADAVKRLATVVRAAGARPYEMDADEHDRLLSRVSHLPQLLSTALGVMVHAEELEKAGSGLRDMLRLAASPYPVWRAILDTNRDNIDGALAEYIGILEQFRRDLRTGEVGAAFSRANALSSAWPATAGRGRSGDA